MQDDDLSNRDDDDTGQAKTNTHLHENSAAEDSQDEESTFEEDPDWRSLEESVEAKENYGDDDQCYSSNAEKDDSRNTLRCVLFFLKKQHFKKVTNLFYPSLVFIPLQHQAKQLVISR